MPQGPKGKSGGENLRQEARDSLNDQKDRWSNYRTKVGDALNNQTTLTFAYLKEALNDTSTAADIFKDGLALWIVGFKTGRDIHTATWDLLYPPDSTT